MVRKLIKHELIAIFRILLILAAATLVFAAVGRLIFAVAEAREGPASGIQDLFLIFYVFVIAVFAIAAWALGANSFYRSLYRGEGYMTFSLPAKPSEIVGAKLIAALVAMLFAAAVSALSFVVFCAGAKEGMLAGAASLFGDLFTIIARAWERSPLLFLEQTLLGIVLVPLSLLTVYTVFAVGQLFTARRRLFTFLLFFGVYIAGALLETYALIPVLGAAGRVSPHFSAWLGIGIIVGLDLICWFLTVYILKRRVNLL